LGFEVDVAGVEDAEVWVVEADADGAWEVACVEEFAIDAGLAEFEAAAGALVAPAALAALAAAAARMGLEKARSCPSYLCRALPRWPRRR
jgi:hypothetical protein